MQPDLSRLFALVEETPAYRAVLADLASKNEAHVSVLEAAKPYYASAMARQWPGPILLLCGQPDACKRLFEQVALWSDGRVKRFPETDVLPYERISSDSLTEMERVQTFTSLAGGCRSEAPLIVASAHAVMGKAPALSDFTSTCHTVQVGTEMEPLEMLRRWERMGYRIESVVEVPGTASHRGGVLDVYPPTSDGPVRLEFFGNTVESVRHFDPASQRSTGPLTSVMIGPATELLSPLLRDRSELEAVLRDISLDGLVPGIREQIDQEIGMILDRQRPGEIQFYAPFFNRSCLLDYLPADALVIVDNPDQVKQAVEAMDAEAEQIRSDKVARGELPANYPRPYFTWKEIEQRIAARRRVVLEAWGGEGTVRLDFSPAPSFAARLPSFTEKLKELQGSGRRVVVVSQQASRLSELLNEEDIIAAPLKELQDVPGPGSVSLVQGSLAEGWAFQNDTFLLTDGEIFGVAKQARAVKRRPVARHKLFADISPGDYVVHVEHGIARFSGVATMGSDGSQREYLVLQYAAGDKLYVPSEQIDRLDRYIGADDKPPALSRLNTHEWLLTRKKAKEAAEGLALELIQLYAARELAPGFAFSPDTVWQQEIEGSFPYVETPDQLEVQKEVKADMEKPRPMDRLVCGDVGYGKTEVAIRAAFKAVMDGKQVAVLVPTTVLAEQHFGTFTERMKPFPVRIESLSRFKSAREQRDIVKGLVDGTVDVCIGTHRLLQKDIAFKDLGLLVVDEEQRFGVAHKEYLKKMRQEVDVLTLSATPIPRTLHMSLTGVRDISTMETPPEERLPIKTFVAEYDVHLVREAILREIERNGQVFFVHNRVQSIGYITAELEKLVPEARFAIGHGQMPEEKLEEVMAAFARGEADVLVCTTIIESGLDMPNVNTVIINQADKLGLTQLYQLRGRVGRGANLAYAYLLYERGKRLTPTAQKRLQTIYEATQLGAGFNIAIKDLEIRGAGTLLGHHQSGQISAVGFSLYTRLLAEAVEEQKAKKAGEPKAMPRKLPDPKIDLPLDAYIPDSYVPDLNSRLELYRDLARAETGTDVDGVSQVLIDRFGPLPDEVRHLLYSVRVKVLATRAHVESIGKEDGRITVRLLQGLLVNRDRLAPFRDRVRIGISQVSLSPRQLGKQWPLVLEEVLGRLGQ